MSFASLPQRWVNAAAVFLRLRLVSQYAELSGQNREASDLLDGHLLRSGQAFFPRVSSEIYRHFPEALGQIANC